MSDNSVWIVLDWVNGRMSESAFLDEGAAAAAAQRANESELYDLWSVESVELMLRSPIADLLKARQQEAHVAGVLLAWKADPANPVRIADMRAIGGHVGNANGRCVTCNRPVDEDGIHWH